MWELGACHYVYNACEKPNRKINTTYVVPGARLTIVGFMSNSQPIGLLYRISGLSRSKEPPKQPSEVSTTQGDTCSPESGPQLSHSLIDEWREQKE